MAAFLCVKEVGVSPAVLSLGLLCEMVDHRYFWKTGKQPSLTTDEWKSEDHVPVAAVTRHQSTPANAEGDSLPDWNHSQDAQPNFCPRPNQREGTLRKTQNQKFLLMRKDQMPSQRVNTICSLTSEKIPIVFARWPTPSVPDAKTS